MPEGSSEGSSEVEGGGEGSSNTSEVMEKHSLVENDNNLPRLYIRYVTRANYNMSIFGEVHHGQKSLRERAKALEELLY